MSDLNNHQAVARLLAASKGALTLAEWLEAYAVAVAPGCMDSRSLALLRSVPLKESARAVQDKILEGAPSLEVLDARERDPKFDARCRTLAGLLKPGDRIVWLCDKEIQPWQYLRATYGACLHVAVVLPGGLLLDPYWPEGTSVATVEVAAARALRRIQSRTACVLRARRVLSSADEAQLLAAAASKLAYAYRLIAPLEQCRTTGSCAKVVYEMHQELALPFGSSEEGRWFRSSVCPGDLAGGACVQVTPDGEQRDLTEIPGRVPSGWPFELVSRSDRLVGHWPVVASGLRGLGDVLTRLVTPRLQANGLEHACIRWMGTPIQRPETDVPWTHYVIPSTTSDVMA